MEPVLWAAGGTGFTCLMTALGAAMVFFFRKRVTAGAQRIFLGFAAGVMVAASVWSLLIPAIEEAESRGVPGWLPAAGGFLLGVGFLMALDCVMPHLHVGASQPEGHSSTWKRTTLLIFAVTLHNIPEGMAVGFPLLWRPSTGAIRPCTPAPWPWPLAWGFKIFRRARPFPFPCGRRVCPPGKAFSTEGFPALWSRFSAFWRCWWQGASSLAALAAGLCRRRHDVCGGGRADPRGPFGRAFQRGDPGVMAGFLVMMVLDVALG